MKKVLGNKIGLQVILEQCAEESKDINLELSGTCLLKQPNQLKGLSDNIG